MTSREPIAEGELIHLAVQNREVDVEALVTQMKALVDAVGRDQAVFSMTKNLVVHQIKSETLAADLAIALAMLVQKGQKEDE